eukprot:CAMPEP_0115008036 /NCGR_PEP_ID=MMETSP0216-20121206/21634_1 /TAXON_ID=223996 /ORGANISM="Protocruzia adherens, Strain Boccale" /LENGTH=646 /DNA_ID=CAMNT_0002375289 /DNA_START=99 /DNA_END=2039 /DNA_ORIENTATION=-
MSRHRHVKGYINEYDDEDLSHDEESEEEYDNFSDDEIEHIVGGKQYLDDQLQDFYDQVDEGAYYQVLEVLGENCTELEVCKALVETDMKPAEAVEWILKKREEEAAKNKKKEQKKKEQEKAQNKAKNQQQQSKGGNNQSKQSQKKPNNNGNNKKPRAAEEEKKQSKGNQGQAKQRQQQEAAALSQMRYNPQELNADYPDVSLPDKVDSSLHDSMLNLVVFGHVDAGKSTLMGHLLFKLGNVDQRTMHKFEKSAKEIGKGSFAYAWVLDEDEEERKRGVTIDVAQKFFQTKSKSVCILDAPGHRDFIPNMISGAAQADVGILVIDSSSSGFETGFRQGGQTREHSILARSLGVTQLIVAINKLDTVDWSEERYNQIKSKIIDFERAIGFKEENIRCTPLSGLDGINMTEPATVPALTSWYSGPCLLDMIDTFKPAKRAYTKPFRLSVTDLYKSSSHGVLQGPCAAGKVEGGCITVNQKVTLVPYMVPCKVKAILKSGAKVDYALSGDSVDIFLTLNENVHDISLMKKGCVLSSSDHVIKIIKKFKCRIMTFELDIPIMKGENCVLHTNSNQVACKITKILHTINKITSEIDRKNPKCLGNNQTALIEVECLEPICLELYKNYPSLGRITLRSRAQTLAAGVVSELML